MTKIKNTENAKYLQECRATGAFIHCWWECKVVWPHWEKVWQFVTKLNVNLPYVPAIQFLGTYARKAEMYVHTKIWAQMFIEAPFIITKRWENPSVLQGVNG